MALSHTTWTSYQTTAINQTTSYLWLVTMHSTVTPIVNGVQSVTAQTDKYLAVKVQGLLSSDAQQNGINEYFRQYGLNPDVVDSTVQLTLPAAPFVANYTI
jgi:hypothetical protein